MKLRINFKQMEILDDLLAIPTGQGAENFRGTLRINGVTADILELLKQETTEEDVIEAMLKEYDATREQIAGSVRKVVATLREEGLLEE